MKKYKKILAVIFFAVCTVFASLALSGCGYCQHKLEDVASVPSTCQEQGLKKAYKCTKCNQLFGYNAAKGVLYEIDEQEPADLAPHTASNELVGVIDEGAESFADVHVNNTCSVCKKTYTVEDDVLFHVSPSDNRIYEHKFEEKSGIFYTEYTLPAGSGADEAKPAIIIAPLSDSLVNTLPTYNTNVPFTSDVSRYVVMFFKNESETDIEMIYAAECYDVICKTEKITVPAGGYATATLEIKFSRTAVRGNHWLYLLTDLDDDVKLDVCGYYYEANVKLSRVALSQTGKTDFIEGEKLDPDEIFFKETYSDNSFRVFSGRAATSKMFNRPLTVDDKEVEIVYGGKKYRYDISVVSTKRSLTIFGAKFVDGTNTHQIRYDADQPNDIVFRDDAIFLYWIDMYGNKYPHGFNMNGSDKILRAVYAGENLTDPDVEDFGTNFALNKDSEVSGTLMTQFPQSGLNDGDTDVAWESQNCGMANPADGDVWCKIDLGSDTDINTVCLFDGSDGKYFPRGYYIEVSLDGETWTKVFVQENDEKTQVPAKRFGRRLCFFDDVKARYVRIVGTELVESDTGYFCVKLGEVEVYHV